VAKRYKMTVTFTGTAMLELDAENAVEAAQKATELTVKDLARQDHVDVVSLRTNARDIRPAGLPGTVADDDDESKPRGPRPSGWYRPA